MKWTLVLFMQIILITSFHIQSKNLHFDKTTNKQAKENDNIFTEFRELINEKNEGKKIQFEDNLELVGQNYAFISHIKDNLFKLQNKENSQTFLQKLVEVHFHKTLLTKGWNKLSLIIHQTDSVKNPFTKAYLGGFLEGRVTYQDISSFYSNFEYNYKTMYSSPRVFNSVKSFLREAFDNLEDKFSKFGDLYQSDADKDYYFKIFIFYAQLKGLLDGYNYQIELTSKRAGRSISGSSNNNHRRLAIEELLAVQADGEMPELMRWMNYKLNRKIIKLGERGYFRKALNIPSDDPNEAWRFLMRKSRCSALIKISGEKEGSYANAELLSGHTSWSDYFDTSRTIKHYKMHLQDHTGASIEFESTFSSYSGCLSSTDDYILTQNRLLVTETTLEVVDVNLYNGIQPENYIPNFMRVNAASFFSKNGKDWVKSLSYLNSGTYSSQWMVVDYNVFDMLKAGGKKANEVQGLLYVLEQTPKGMETHDLTNQLLKKNSYYASFNRSFFSQTNEDLHMTLLTELYGDAFSFNGSARAKIFQALHSTVKDLKSFKDVLRYNGYKMNSSIIKDDPSYLHPGRGISARFDLEADPALTGGIDCKITNSEMVKKLTSVMISGPTTENNPNLPVFRWDNFKDSEIQHIGLPAKYDFGWILASPENIKNNNKNDDNFQFR